MKALSAIAAGHICLDIYPDLSHLTPTQFQENFIPGHLMTIGPLFFSTGGAVSNTGLALHTLGVETQLMGKIGNDFVGQVIKDILQNFDPSLVVGMVEDAKSDSSYTIVITPPDIDRYLLHCPGANDTFSANDINYSLLETVSLFHFGYPPLMKEMYAGGGRELARIFRLAKQAGVTTSLDTAFVGPESIAGQSDWRVILTAALPFVDIFMPSIEEILFMLRRDQYKDLQSQATDEDIIPLLTPELLSSLGSELLNMGAPIVALKLGNRGLYVRTGSLETLSGMGRGAPADLDHWADQELWSPCFEVKVAGTAGSGDATIAGFLSALLREASPLEAINAAVAVGACNVEKVDTLSGIQTWEATMARIDNGWPKKKLNIEADGWSYDTNHQVWSRF